MTRSAPIRAVRSAPLRALLGVPAVAMLAVAPVSAAAPGRHWVSICTGEGARWIALEAVPGSPAAPIEDDRRHGMCAHATCPREDRLERKARVRS